MPQETETVTGNPDGPQQTTDTAEKEQELVNPEESEHQPIVQEDACILKQASKPETDAPEEPEGTAAVRNAIAASTEAFLLGEKQDYEKTAVDPQTPANSESSDAGTPAGIEEQQQEQPETTTTPAPQVIEVSLYNETVTVESSDGIVVAESSTSLYTNGSHTEGTTTVDDAEASEEAPITNGACDLKPTKEAEEEPVIVSNGRSQVLHGTIASELEAEDYKLPDVVEVKKQFEHAGPTVGQNATQAPPKKGTLSTNLDAEGVKRAYTDVRNDVSKTEWAVFKFQGPTIVTSATGTEFGLFKKQFGDDERAFGYIRVQTGDEMSKRAKFLLVTWVGPSVSVLKRAKMSIDKAVIKDVVTNFAVELQTENISDINLQNFETVLDKAAGAHYGTGVRS